MTVPDSKEPQLVNGIPRQYGQRTSIQHWQLRDLICFADNDPTQIFSVYHSQVTAYNSQTKTSHSLIRDLGFQPTCMAANHGYVAVGGQRSQVVVRSLGNDWVASTTVGGAINNCVHLAYHEDQVRLLVCNNDETIKIFNLPSMEHLHTIRLNTAVNGISVSPDGTKMVAVGDTNQVFLFSINRSASNGSGNGSSSGREYEQIGTLTTVKDAGFSCAWDQTSTKFAVGCQDGWACVWDIRSSKRMAQLASTQPNGRGAVRSVKFSQTGSVDLLAFTEHTSYMNVVDARTFDTRDTIRIGQPISEINLTGLAFSPDSRSIFVGTEQVLLQYDVNTRKRRGFPSGQIFNLDYYTENYPLSFYMKYLMEWPQYNQVAVHASGRIIAYVMGKCEGKGKNWHGHITAISVAPDFRRLGIATNLIKHVERISEEEGMYFVDLFVRKSNKQAIQMYEKMGYSVYRTILDYYSSPDEDAYDMRKALSRDINKESIIPIPYPVHAADLD